MHMHEHKNVHHTEEANQSEKFIVDDEIYFTYVQHTSDMCALYSAKTHGTCIVVFVEIFDGPIGAEAREYGCSMHGGI